MTYGQGLGGGGGGNALPAGSMGSLMNSSAGRGMGGMGGGMSLGMAALQPQPASTMMGQQQQQQQQVAGGQSKAGLDKYQSLL